MIKLMLLSLLIITGCSSRIINGKEQNFYEYVIVNKNSDWEVGSTFANLEPECFPIIRLQKWNESK
ncbi:MAG: hypothetical protein ACRCX2_17230 [Paraclostridium sp.]